MSSSDSTATQRFYVSAYTSNGLGAQRRYPNEELCRFMGRHFFGIENAKRRDVRILEVGCGSGANLWMIAREGFDAYGIDLSPEAIKLAQRTLEQYGTSATLAAGDMTACPFPDSRFACIVDVFSCNCLDEAAFRKFAREAKRLLAPGGLLFTYTPSKASDAFQDHVPARKIDASTLDGIRRETSPFLGNNYPFRFTTTEELNEILGNEGFTVTYGETAGRTYRGGEEYFEFVVLVAEKRA